MSLTQSTQDDHTHLLTAQMDNVRNLSSILKTVQFRETASCFISDKGLRVVVEQAKCVQANAFIQSSVFQKFSYHDTETAVFCINLNVLIDCLTIFGSGSGSSTFEAYTSLKMTYDGQGHPLRLLLTEGDVVTDCVIQTQEADETLDFDFISSNVTNKVIMKSECMKESFSEIDMTSDVLEMNFSLTPAHFRMATYGYAGNTQFDFPRDSDVIEVFEVTKTQTNKYKLALLKPSTKALGQSSKIAVRMDKRGFLSLQYMIVTEERHVCFVEYLCVPDEEVDEG